MSAGFAPKAVDDGAEVWRDVAAFGHVQVFSDPMEARGAWQSLERTAPCSPYQTWAWCLPWLATIGASVEPAIAVAFDTAGSALALLPLCVERRGALRLGCFIGGRDSNTGMGLFAPGTTPDAEVMVALLNEIATLARIDLFWLRNQPYRWAGWANPLATLPRVASPSQNHRARLQADPEQYFRETVSRSSRKHLRQKRAKLAAEGHVQSWIARSGIEIGMVLDAYARHRTDRARLRGESPSDIAASAPFLSRAARPASGKPPAVELHALAVDDRIVATFGAARHGTHYAGMVTSFDQSCARHSPGDLLIAEVIATACRAGYETFDLGIGEARYKSTFCPEAEPLFDTIVGTTAAGRIAALGLRGWVHAKRRIKGTAWLWAAAQAIRRTGRRSLTRVSG